MQRESIYLAWQRLVDQYNTKVQELKAQGLSPETRLAQETRLESVILAGLAVIAEALDSETERQQKVA